jgi:chromosome segregation ATPase
VLRSDKGKINEAVRKHNQAVRAQKKSEAVVTARLQGISNELGGISGELQSALTTSKKIQSQLDHASRQTQADERQQEKMENMALQLASTIARTIAEIASMEAELSSVPLFDTARKKELKNKIHQSRQKLEDLKSYEASGKIMPVGNIQNEDIESLKSMDLQNQQDINNLTKQYEDIISKVPEAYKKELFFYMEGNQKSKEAKAHGKVFSNHHKSK